MKPALYVVVAVAVVLAVAYYLTDIEGTSDVDVPSGEGGFGLDTLYANTIGSFGAIVSGQTVSQNGIQLIQSQESCRLTAYWDVNAYSIGWGHHDASEGQTCTQDQADAWLLEDATAAAQSVLKYCRVGLSQNQLDALTDWIYNLGASKVKNATLWTLLNAGQYDQVPAQLLRWCYSGGQQNQGLLARRQAEANLWNGGGN